jgi:hypothetical protein
VRPKKRKDRSITVGVQSAIIQRFPGTRGTTEDPIVGSAASPPLQRHHAVFIDPHLARRGWRWGWAVVFQGLGFLHDQALKASQVQALPGP